TEVRRPRHHGNPRAHQPSFASAQLVSCPQQPTRWRRRPAPERGVSMKEAGREEDGWAADGRGLSLPAWCVVAAFGTYFCMYAFRKPFTAASYPDVIVWGMGYKTVLITAQVLGYTLSKFLGIKVVAEVQPHRRVALLLGLIAAAEAALLLFGL